MQGIKTADWSEEVAPFWGAVIRSALSAQGFAGLFKAGWTTIKARVLAAQRSHAQDHDRWLPAHHVF